MAQFESTAFLIGIMCLTISMAAAILEAFTNRKKTARNKASSGLGIPRFIHLITLTGGLIAISVSLIIRATSTGHGPFSSMYEFAVAFSWGILVMALIFGWTYKLPLISTIGVIIALAMLIFAANLSSKAVPLVPALQQSLLLTTHVASAVISYGALTIGFGAAIMYLVKSGNAGEAEILDRLSYQTVIIGFPFLTLVIILGAVWADIAWGRYWNWDPKETASLVTWLLYAVYLHARITRGWRGKKAAVLLIIGFAAVLLTFFGNYIFSGLHAYA
jgi:ABC-type transport system involved in cytochrome c biogenesis permease subunit